MGWVIDKGRVIDSVGVRGMVGVIDNDKGPHPYGGSYSLLDPTFLSFSKFLSLRIPYPSWS